MAIDPLIARGFPGIDLTNTMATVAELKQRDRALDIGDQRNALMAQENQQTQITAQQQQALLRKYSEIQALKKLPPEAAARWFEQQKPEPGFANTPWANAPAEQAIPAIEAQIASVLGMVEQEPKQAPSLPSEIQRYQYGLENPGFREYEDRNRPQPAPREPRPPSEWEQYQAMGPEQRKLYDQWKGRDTPPGQGEVAPTGGVSGFGDMPAGTKLTEVQGKNYLGASMIAENLPGLTQQLDDGYVPTRQDLFAVGPPLKGVANSFMQEVTPREKADPRALAYFNSGSKILTAILRPESGGAITEDEWTMYGPMYLPWPGDTSEERARKVESIRSYEKRLAQVTGPAAGYYKPSAASKPKASGSTTKNPEVEAALNPKEGQRGKSRSGKPIIFRNGQWEYE